MLAGAGRETKDAAIDLAAGCHLERLRGERVQKGDILACLMASSKPISEEAVNKLKEAFHISETAPDAKPLIYDIIDGSSSSSF